MRGLLSDFLASHAQRVSTAWARTLESTPEYRTSPVTGAQGAKHLLNAVQVALSADDLTPLLTYYELDGNKLSGIDQRLDVAFRELEALCVATNTVAENEKLDMNSRLGLATACAAELGGIARNLASTTSRALAQQLTTVSSSATTYSSSLSVTMHELRRPLTILNSYGQLLSTGMLGALPETAKVAVDGITASTEMMIRLVNALSEVSRLEDPDDELVLENASTSELVSGAVDYVSMEAKLGEVTLEPIVEDVALQIDRRRVNLALTNMLSNAIKHAPNGTTVTIRAEKNEGNVRFTVVDHGAGFPNDDAPHLFDKYFRSVAERQRSVPGSGLGLFIVKTVAERHGGTVSARSDPKKGTEFEMNIPTRETA